MEILPDESIIGNAFYQSKVFACASGICEGMFFFLAFFLLFLFFNWLCIRTQPLHCIKLDFVCFYFFCIILNSLRVSFLPFFFTSTCTEKDHENVVFLFLLCATRTILKLYSLNFTIHLVMWRKLCVFSSFLSWTQIFLFRVYQTSWWSFFFWCEAKEKKNANRQVWMCVCVCLE